VQSPSTLARGVLALILLGSAGLARARSPEPAAVFDADPAAPGAGTLQGDTWSRQLPTAALWLTRIDESTRTRFVRVRSGLDFDPFMTAPGHTSGFVTFHVLVENHGEARLVFQPQACRLETSYKDSQSPMDLPTIWAAFEMSGRPVPTDIGRIRSAIIDGEVVLLPGEQRDGLLVYRAFDPKAKRFQVDCRATLANGDAITVSAFYKKRKKGRTGEGP
jgi:hypothetical protein